MPTVDAAGKASQIPPGPAGHAGRECGFLGREKERLCRSVDVGRSGEEGQGPPGPARWAWGVLCDRRRERMTEGPREENSGHRGAGAPGGPEPGARVDGTDVQVA